MKDTEHHCPFLEQADPRCSRSLSLQRVSEAFAHCFAQYHCCSVFDELRTEKKRLRLSSQRRAQSPRVDHAVPTFVQVTIARRYPKPFTVVEAVPALSGVGAGSGR